MEHKRRVQILGVAPHYPSNTRIDLDQVSWTLACVTAGISQSTHQPVFVTRNIDTDHSWKPKVPFYVWLHKRRNEAPARRIHVDGSVQVAFDEKVVDGFDIFIFARVGSS